MENVKKVTVSNMAELVHETFRKCLFDEGEDTNSSIIVEGITTKYGFNPKKIKENKDQIKEIVNELPEQFKLGYTFLHMCLNKEGQHKEGQHWGEQHTCELLMVMAVAADIMAYCLPRNKWDMFPGDVPYVIIK